MAADNFTEIYSETLEPNGINLTITHLGNGCYEYFADYEITPEFARLLSIQQVNDALGYYLAENSSRNALPLESSHLCHLIFNKEGDDPIIFFDEINYSQFPENEGRNPDKSPGLGHLTVVGRGATKALPTESIGFFRYAFHRDNQQIPEAIAGQCLSDLNPIDQEGYRFTRNPNDLSRFAIIAYEVIPTVLNYLIKRGKGKEAQEVESQFSSN